MKAMQWTLGGLFALGLVACGGGSESTESSESGGTMQSSGGEEGRRADRDDGVEIEGLMGTLSQMEIQRGLEPRMNRFLQCFERRWGQVEVLGGRIELAFRIARDGSVRWVYPRRSSVGDRETERCMLDVARAIRFPQPHGGEAEFAFPLDVDPPDDVRPPLNWDEEHMADTDVDRAAMASSCGGSFVVTAYVAPGGGVITAGAATASPEAAEQIDCVVDAVRAVQMRDPGSYPAKVTFTVP